MFTLAEPLRLRRDTSTVFELSQPGAAEEVPPMDIRIDKESDVATGFVIVANRANHFACSQKPVPNTRAIRARLRVLGKVLHSSLYLLWT
jgi:hypothetical protein